MNARTLFSQCAALFGLCLSLTTSAFAQTAPIRIMPLGDSITDGTAVGTAGAGGYRLPLYNSLTTAGYNVDYIGTLTNNGALIPNGELQHEGHSGWTIGQIYSNIEGWLGTMADPDVVLMHIGTNDFGSGALNPTAIDQLDALILRIATLRPYAHIVVTNLMERAGAANTNIVAQFNPYVQARVDAHALAGRRVTFLDMRSAVPITDMPDSLHPNQTGYDKMAAAWLPALQAVIGVNGDNAPPAISKARGATDQTHAVVTFTKPVADSAATVGNFSLSGGLTISAAVLDAAKRSVTLTTSAQTVGTTYTVTVSNIQDRLTPTPNSISPSSTATFQPIIPRGYLNNVPESLGYTLATSLDVPNAAFWRTAQPPYSVDNRNSLGTFDRIAYYLELQSGDGQLQYLWASMDAFTTDVAKIAVPTVASGAQFQQAVTGMNVVSNAAGIVTGTGLSGNLEFWPTNYTQINSANIAGASATNYDFGDQPTAGTYGSMQLHNAAAGQTLFALNNWGAATGTPGDIDLGIGNDPAPVNTGVDWTFHHNAASYSVKSLQVLVRTSNDVTPPALASASESFSRTQVFVTFSEPVAASSISALNFTLSNGVAVLGATLQPNQRDVTLLTTLQPAATSLTLTVSNVRDTSPNANKISPASTITVTVPGLPTEILTNVGAPSNGYQVVYSVNLPVSGNFVAAGAGAYNVNDSAALGTFSRVAYYLELQTAGSPSQYVWASMDAFSMNRNKIGVPTFASGAIFQQNVTNLDVRSNVAGVVTGTTATGGNIEFWPNDYSVANAVPITNASATTFDFGDTRSTLGNFGSMQIHNHTAAQTVMAVNHFGADGNVLDLGIGTQASGNPDWTFAANAGNFTKRVLHVLVLPGSTAPVAITANVPEAANYQMVYSLDIPNAGNLSSGTNFVNYTVNNSAEVSQFSRVAYYMELQKTGEAASRYVWVSMDAFTNLPGRIGVPNLVSGAFFQQKVNNMNVFSNAAGIVTGSNITTGNIEFWPGNYNGTNALNIPNASASNFDWGDGGASAAAGYGSMQVHNHGASQTLFALNNFGIANATNAHCVGIGNNPTPVSAGVDWTFADNSLSYDIKKLLQVYVLPGNGDTTPPTIATVVGSTKLNRFMVTFSESVADTAAAVANFTVPGLTVQRAELMANQKDVAVYTTTQTSGTVYTVSISGVRDRSSAGNLIANGASATFTAYTAPAVLANAPETAGYDLIYRLAIPSATPQWNVNTLPYTVDEAKYGERLFDRVGYLMQLDGNWVYASFDRHTTSVSKIGVPTLNVTGAAFQQFVTNLNVATNVAGITTGTGITTGNIEFWGGNYDGVNALNVPGANATTFDFGDRMTAGGHGSMQIHNYGASQVLMAYNNWGSNAGQVSDLGIGNYPTPSVTGSGAQLDYTFAANAASYTTRNLFVLARNGGTGTGSAPIFASQPLSRTINVGGAVTLSTVVSGAGPLTYQWRKGGTPITGATSAWLELTNLTAVDAANYDVVVTSGTLVSATSLPAAITVNALPTFAGYALKAVKNTPVSLGVAKLISRAADSDGGTITVVSAAGSSAQGGTVVKAGSTVTYTPANNYVGLDTFTVTISDGQGGTVLGTITVTVSDGTAPTDNQAQMTLLGNGNVALLFFGIPGRSYEIQRSTDLLLWTTIQTVTSGTDGSLPATDTSPPVGRAYYRTKTP